MTVYTIGHSNRSLEELVRLLRDHSIQVVVDVRSRPFSRWRHFCRPSLEQSLPECQLGYIWLGGELGGYREGSAYEQYMETEAFSAGIDRLEQVASGHLAAVLCAEGRPDRCHRRHITGAMEQRGWTVLHIINPEEVWSTPDGPQPTLGL